MVQLCRFNKLAHGWRGFDEDDGRFTRLFACTLKTYERANGRCVEAFHGVEIKSKRFRVAVAVKQPVELFPAGDVVRALQLYYGKFGHASTLTYRRPESSD